MASILVLSCIDKTPYIKVKEVKKIIIKYYICKYLWARWGAKKETDDTAPKKEGNTFI